MFFWVQNNYKNFENKNKMESLKSQKFYSEIWLEGSYLPTLTLTREIREGAHNVSEQLIFPFLIWWSKEPKGNCSKAAKSMEEQGGAG